MSTLILLSNGEIRSIIALLSNGSSWIHPVTGSSPLKADSTMVHGEVLCSNGKDPGFVTNLCVSLSSFSSELPFFLLK